MSRVPPTQAHSLYYHGCQRDPTGPLYATPPSSSAARACTLHKIAPTQGLTSPRTPLANAQYSSPWLLCQLSRPALPAGHTTSPSSAASDSGHRADVRLYSRLRAERCGWTDVVSDPHLSPDCGDAQGGISSREPHTPSSAPDQRAARQDVLVDGSLVDELPSTETENRQVSSPSKTDCKEQMLSPNASRGSMTCPQPASTLSSPMSSFTRPVGGVPSSKISRRSQRKIGQLHDAASYYSQNSNLIS